MSQDPGVPSLCHRPLTPLTRLAPSSLLWPMQSPLHVHSWDEGREAPAWALRKATLPEPQEAGQKIIFDLGPHTIYRFSPTIRQTITL